MEQAYVSKENLQEYSQSVTTKYKTIFATKSEVGSPLVAATAAAMVDTTKIYVYVGSEAGYNNGDWYYYDGSAWADGGVYNSTALVTDTTLTHAGEAADAKATGDAMEGLKDDLGNLTSDFESITDKVYTELLGTRTDGVFIRYDNTIAATGGSYYVVKYDISDLKIVIISGTVGKNGYEYMITDADDTFLKNNGVATRDAITGFTDVEVNCPENAKYLYVQSIESASKPQASAKYMSEIVVKGLPQIKEKLDSIELYPSVTEFVSYTDYEGKYINYNGEEVDTVSSYHLAVATVTSGDDLIILGSNKDTNYQYAFYDNNDNLISGNKGTGTGISAFNAIVKVPENAVTLKVNYNTSNDRTESCAIIEKIESKIADAYGWKALKWTCLGDSLTANNTASGKHYFDYIEDRTGIVTVNMGVGGTGYAKGYDAQTSFFDRIEDVPIDSDIVTIFGSFNDLSSGLPIGDATDTELTSVAGYINATIDALFTKIPLVKLGIVTPTPWKNNTPTSGGNIDNYVNLIKTICQNRGIPCLDLFHCSGLRPWDATYRSLAYSFDGDSGIHPDYRGQKIIAPRFEEFLSSLILS